jgi:O-antigen/teichoic acid export membrane protein
MQSVRRSHRVISNAIYNLIPQIWFLLLTVFTTPFVLHRLGVDAYGILSIVTIVAGYLAFLDLGLNSAVIKFIAAHDAKGESSEIRRVIQTAMSVFILMALAAAALLYVFSGSLARILQTPGSMQPAAVLALRLSAVSFGVNLVMGVFSAVPRALQRFDLVNALNLILGTLQILGTVLLLISGFHLQSVIVWGCALSGISLITYIIIAKRLVPMMSLRPRFDPEKFRELFKFSGFVMASNFTGVAAAHSEKLILGGMAPIAQVTYYAVPFNLASRVLNLIPNNLFSVLFPAFAAMGVTDKQETIREAYTRAFKFIFLAVAPISVLMGAFGSDLLRLWIDADMGTYGGPVLAVLAVAILINAPAWVSVTVGQSLGRPALVAASQMIHLLALIVSGVILVPRYGAFGAGLAWLAGNAIGIPVLVFLVNRHVLGLRTLTMLRESLLRPVCAASLSLAVALLLKPIVSGWLTLVLACTVVTGFYLAIAYRASLNVGDREMFKTFVVNRYQAALRAAPKIAKNQI